MTYTLNACIPCTTKKRKCDRRLPKCSTCARSKSNRECVYKNSVDGALVHSDPKLSPALSIRSGTSPQLQQLPKSPVACEKCRVGKRACSKDSPRCSRCERLNVSCNYEFARDLELKDHPETQNQLVRTKPHRSTLLLESPYGLPYKAQYPVPEQSHFRALIHTYSQTYWLPETHRAPNSLTTHLATVWMRRAMADPCLFHGTLFSASAHLDWVQGISHNPRTLYHQAQALTLLRERLQRDQICYETVATAEALIYYNMSAYNTESALVHKRGLLQMLAMNRDRGEDFGALTGLVNLILLGFSMVLNQAPPAVQGMSTAPIDISTFLKPALGPSDILSRALLRHTSKNNDTLYASTIVELQNILDFILLAEHASFADMYALYTHASERRTADTTDISLPKDTTKTTRAINQAANIAINIFWTVFYNYLYPDPEPESGLFSPTSPQTSSSVEEANSDTKQSREQPLIESLHIVLQKIDILSWQHLAPEIYVWVSLTAAAACRTSEERIPFITALTPLLSAEDSAELELSGMGWVYFQWVGGFVC